MPSSYCLVSTIDSSNISPFKGWAWRLVQNKLSSINQDIGMFLLRFQEIRNQSAHQLLKEDLIEHLWKKRAESSQDLGDKSND
ncbi:hypothetical protein VP01_2043g4 [Puccinia sorghi]|uniref:Uncharacterized protein n=1 Tax=Puccinia sorghi TaxID=27349 RepID=A0A0L6VAU4_9BASI|nr:hypothetical protein VP01_2043g4 [Puccinia sorghi]